MVVDMTVSTLYTGFLEGGFHKDVCCSLKTSAGSETTAQCTKHTLQNAEHVLFLGGLGRQEIFRILAFRD